MPVWMYISLQRGLQRGYHSDLAPETPMGGTDSLRLMTCGSAAAYSSGCAHTSLRLTRRSGLWMSHSLDLSLQGPLLRPSPQSYQPRLCQISSSGQGLLWPPLFFSFVSSVRLSPWPQPPPPTSHAFVLHSCFPDVSFAHLAPWRLFLKALN